MECLLAAYLLALRNFTPQGNLVKMLIHSAEAVNPGGIKVQDSYIIGLSESEPHATFLYLLYIVLYDHHAMTVACRVQTLSKVFTQLDQQPARLAPR